MDSFWRTWRCKFTKTQLPSVIDGCHDEKDKADKFASVFQSVCVPNNATRHAELCEDFSQLIPIATSIVILSCQLKLLMA